MKTLLVFLALFYSFSAEAKIVWNYRLEPTDKILGGKVKISEIETKQGYRQIKFKYKMQTVVGYKESWLPYNFPQKIFDREYLLSLPLKIETHVGSYPHGWEAWSESFRIIRETPVGGVESFRLRTKNNKNKETNEFRIFVNPAEDAWSRIEFTVMMGGYQVQIFGDLEDVVDE